MIAKLEFFINELFECCLSIDCDRQQIEQDNQFFQLENLQISQSNRRFKDEINGEQQVINGTSRRHRHSHTSSSSRKFRYLIFHFDENLFS